MPENQQKILVLIFEKEQLDAFLNDGRYKNANSTTNFIFTSNDLEIENYIRKNNLPVLSIREFALRYDYASTCSWGINLARSWYMNEDKDLLLDQGVSFGRAYELAMYIYAYHAAYYSDLLQYLSQIAGGAKEVIVPFSTQKAKEHHGLFVRHELNLLHEVFSLLGREYGLKVSVIGPKNQKMAEAADIDYAFLIKSEISNFLFAVQNKVLSVFDFRKKTKQIYISDYWKNTQNYVDQIKDAKITFMDRGQYFSVGLKKVLSHRLAFRHIDSMASAGIKNEAKAISKSLNEKWRTTKRPDGNKNLFIYKGYDLSPLFSPVIEDVLGTGIQTLAVQYLCSVALIKKCQIDLVIVRASVSAQTHFFALAAAAAMCKIPSLEIQHGLEFNGALSLSTHKNVSDIAVLSQDDAEYLQGIRQSLGAVVTGMPRFDSYLLGGIQRSKSIDREQKLTVLAVMPEISAHISSFDVEEFFKNLAKIHSDLPTIKFIVKIRPGHRVDFFRQMFNQYLAADGNILAEDEPIMDLCVKSDLAISVFSTLIVEAGIIGCIVIPYTLHAFERIMSESRFGEKIYGIDYKYNSSQELSVMIGWLEEKFTKKRSEFEALAESVASNARKQFYCDGHAGTRVAQYINKLLSGI